MNLPTGLVCAKCGKMFGVIFNAPVEKLQGVKIVCGPCANKVAAAKGLKLDTAESWEEVLKD